MSFLHRTLPSFWKIPAIFLLFILVMVSYITLMASAASAQHFTIDVKKKVLDNGVTILVWERPSAGRIGTRSFYKVDIAAERPGTAGLTHMLEHHLFKGSDIAGTSDWEAERDVALQVEHLERLITDEENRNRDCFLQRDVFEEVESGCSTPRIDSLRAALVEATSFQNSLAHTTWYDWAVQSAGGTNSTASTGRDWMKFDIDLPANKLELFMWTERSRVEHPVFRHFEPEKEVVVDQIRRYDNRPDGKFSRVMRSMTYDAHPYGWAHWFSDLTRATREDHWEIFHKYFIPQNTVLVVVGEVDAEDVFRMAEDYWGSWQKGRPSPRLRTVEPEPVGQKRLTVDAAAGPAVAMNVPMPAVGHEDAHVFDVLAELLGGTRGLLAAELIENLQIATGTGATGWTSKYPSHFEIRVDGRSNDDLDAIETGINTVIGRIAGGQISRDEINAAGGRLMLNLAQNLDEIGRSAVTIGSMEAIYGWEHLNELPRLWSQVTTDDLARIARRYFGTAMQTVGHLRRTSSAATAERGETTDSARSYIEGSGAGFDTGFKAGFNESSGADSANPEFGRHDSEALNSVRPGSWPAGGPVGEFFLNPESKMPAAGAARTGKNANIGKFGMISYDSLPAIDHQQSIPYQLDSDEGQLTEKSRLQQSGSQSRSGFQNYSVTQTWIDSSAQNSNETPAQVESGNPLALAEQPWYSPPWMADRRPSGFSTPSPAADFRDLVYEPVRFTPPDPDDYRIELDNGLTAFLVPDPLLPMAQVTVLINAPSMADPEGKEGLAALTADLLRSGTISMSGQDIENSLNKMGATLSIDSDRNRTRIRAVSPSTEAGELISLLGSMIAEPDFGYAFEAERERHALRAGRASDNAAIQVRSLFEEALYGKSHPFGVRPTPESVRSISLQDVRRFHESHYTAGRITFSISGDISGAGIESWLRQSPALRNLAATTADAAGGGTVGVFGRELTSPEKPDGIHVITRNLDTRQGLVIMGHPGIEGQPDDHAALEVMHHILAGGGFISRMMELLRTQTGITSALFGEVEPGRGTPNPYLWRFGGNTETIAEGIYLALEEIRKMHSDGVTEYEFEAARTSYIDGLVPASYDTPHKTAERLAQKHLFGLYDYQSPQYLNYYAGDGDQLDALRRLTLDEVNRAARKYLDPENMIITIVGPLDEIRYNASEEVRNLLGW